MKTFILLFTCVLFSSCAKEDSCGDLEPVNSEFVINCKSYETGNAYFKISRTSGYPAAFGKLFITNKTQTVILGGEFPMKNINYVELNLNIPWATIDNIPQGTYVLDSFLTQEEFTIENHANVYYNSFLRDPAHFDLKNAYGSEFDDITITVLRDGNIYDIQYVLVINGKNIKGHYRGSLTQIYY